MFGVDGSARHDFDWSARRDGKTVDGFKTLQAGAAAGRQQRPSEEMCARVLCPLCVFIRLLRSDAITAVAGMEAARPVVVLRLSPATLGDRQRLPVARLQR